MAEENESSSEESGLPEGMRVVREEGRRKAARNVQTVQLKKRDPEPAAVDKGAESSFKAQSAGSEQVEAEGAGGRKRVRRSQSDGGKPVEEQWGGAKPPERGGLSRVALVGFSLLIPVLAIIMGFTLINRETGSIEPKPNKNLDLGRPVAPREEDDVVSPITWFHNNTAEAFQSAVTIMEDMNEGGGAASHPNWLRNRTAALAKIKQDGPGWDSGFFVADPRRLAWEFGSLGETGFMTITGRRLNHSKFRAYFVRTEEGLRMDWEATSAWSEVPIGRLTEEASGQPVLVRCWLAKNASYDTLEPPGHLLSWYLILSPDKSDYVWARVPAGKAMDEELKAVLDYNLFVLQRKAEVRAVIRVVRPPDAKSENEFEVVELITRDWVAP